MAQPSRDAMLVRLVDIVAEHYRHSNITLLLNGQPHNGTHRPTAEHFIVIDFRGPYKEKKDGQV